MHASSKVEDGIEMSFPNRSFSLASFQTDAHRVYVVRRHLFARHRCAEADAMQTRSRRTSHIHFMTFPFDCIVYALASANKTSTIFNFISFYFCHFQTTFNVKFSIRYVRIHFPFTTISHLCENIAKLEKFSSSSNFYGFLLLFCVTL